MSLRRVDKLVREEKYEQALQVLLEVRAAQPNNPYLPAYEERLRSAIEIRSHILEESSGSPETRLGTQHRLEGKLPSVEEQLKAIARPVQQVSEPKHDARAIEQKRRQDQRRVALLSKIASLIGCANEYLEKGDFEHALEEVARANMLDPGNVDIADLERRIRSSQEEAQRVAEEQRRLAIQREEQEREKRIRRQREDALREADDRRLREEQARRAAQQQKVALCLQRSREFLGSGLLDEAQAELAFALVVEPQNSEANVLERELTQRYEERRQAELTRRREEEEERRREEERIATLIGTAVREAKAAADRGEFAKALARITEAYIDDPGNPALAACESEILTARDAWARKQKEEALAAEEARRKAQEEEERRHQEEERRRVLEEREAQARNQQKEEEEQLWYHLRRAKTLLANGKHDQALAEVALAFVVNPFSEDVKQLEAEILLAQGAASIQGSGKQGSAEEPPNEEEQTGKSSAELRSILERATIHGTRKEFALAFEEIARAYALSPLEPAVAECENRIRSAFVRYQEEMVPLGARSEHAQPSKAEDAPARPARRRTARRARVKKVDPLGAAPSPSLKAATARSGGGARFARVFMSLVTLGAVSVSTVYLVNSNATLPDSADSSARSDQTEIQRSSSTLSSPDAGTRSSGEFAERGRRQFADLLQNPPVRRGRSSAAIEQAGFSPIAELSEEGAQELVPPEVSEQTNATKPQVDPSAAGGTDDSAGSSREDTLSEQSPDLYASSALPGRSLTQSPQIVRLSRPQLTDVTQRSVTEEEITVMVEIGADGAPLQARVTRSTYPPYNHAVIDAVMRSEFQAGLTPSGPAAKWMTIPFRIKP